MSVRGDSLQPDNEFPDEYIEDCPWMEMTMKDYGVITEFDHPFKKTGKNIKSRDLDFDIDESENSVFDNKSIKAGPDFIRNANSGLHPELCSIIRSNTKTNNLYLLLLNELFLTKTFFIQVQKSFFIERIQLANQKYLTFLCNLKNSI